jgi:hypothetical protein
LPAPNKGARIGSRVEMKLLAGTTGVVGLPGVKFTSIEHVNRDTVEAAISEDGSQLTIKGRAPGNTSVEVGDAGGVRHLVLIRIEPPPGDTGAGGGADSSGTTSPGTTSSGTTSSGTTSSGTSATTRRELLEKLKAYEKEMLNTTLEDRIKAYERAYQWQTAIASGAKDAAKVDRATLIRRLYLDIMGVPPTPADVKAFVEDENESAPERLVGRLLKERPADDQRVLRAWFDAIGRPKESKKEEEKKGP